MVQIIRSLWIWTSVGVLILVWLPFLALVRVTDRDPIHYRTGRWFRRLGVAMTRLSAPWKLRISGERINDPRHPYVVVSNHQSQADIPLIAHLPWEMKWVAKRELFRTPVVGWLMKLAGDIPVDRSDPRSGAFMLRRAQGVLARKCSVMFFPEGTRSPDGLVSRFNDGAFHLAITAGVPVLPVAIEGSRDCLPKKSWRFGSPPTINVKVLPPVETSGLGVADVGTLRDRVRERIVRQIAEWRGVPPAAVDRLADQRFPAVPSS